MFLIFFSSFWWNVWAGDDNTIWQLETFPLILYLLEYCVFTKFLWVCNGKYFQFPIPGTTTGQFFRLSCFSFRIWALFLGTNCQFYSFRFQTLLMSKLRGMKLNRKCQKIRLRIHKSKKIGLRIHKSHLEIWISIRVLHENMFLKKRNGSTRSVSIWGWLGRNPKGFFMLISFKGCTTHFRFDNF